MAQQRFQGQVALVTGAASGMGRVIALRLASGADGCLVRSEKTL
jgi:NAD(P)-dependent dehydrogenase (short-subunit alcohol dehydrogenase family)